jgi:oligosaccharide repeat unit polymerase
MSLRVQTNYLSPTRPLDNKLPVFKVVGALVCALMLGLLVALRIVPSFRISTLVLLIASASFLLVKSGETSDLLHPIRIFGGLWCFCVAVASMRLYPGISDWNFVMWSCIITALVSFVCGFWLNRRFSNRRPVSPRVDAGEVVSTRGLLQNRKTLTVAVFCILIGTAVLAYEYYLVGGIPVFAENVDAARGRLFGIAGQGDPQFDLLYIKLIHPLVDFIKYGVFLAVIILCQRKAKNRKVVTLSIAIISFGTLALASQGGRGFIVNIAITSVVLFHYLHRRIRLVEFGAAGLALFLFLGLFGSLRAKQGESAPLFQRALSTSSLPEGEFWDGISFGYGTLTLSFEVFNRLIEDLPTTQRPAGGYLFYAFHRFVPRANIQNLDLDLYSGETVTPTFLGEFYGDYGYWGVLFGPLLLGLGYGWAYRRGDEEKTIYWIYVRALLIQMLIFFPYVNLFSMYLTWIFDLFFMYFLIRLGTQETESFALLTSTNGARLREVQ